MSNNSNIEHYFTIEEVSKYLQIAKGTIYRYTMNKTIPCFKVGKRVRFSKDSIDKWVEKLEKKRPKRRKRR